MQLALKDYNYVAEEHLWVSSKEETGLAYSDGEEVEKYLKEVLENANDLSCGSEELKKAIRDWPSEYHLSPDRANLLRALDLSSAENVCELGAGCGALTRYLGECGLEVLALEGSRARAALAALRTRDLSNVQVVVDRIRDFKPEQSFDLVTLIGVLEYSNIYDGGRNAPLEMLKKCFQLLKPGGALVVAIENQLGLKYLAGHAEDHTGLPFFGIYDLYSPTGPVTFGRHELKKLLESAGFFSLQWLYPFPDYKLPKAIISERAAENYAIRIADFLNSLFSRSYLPKKILPAFDETLARRVFERNKLFYDFANSFLVIAYRDFQGLQLTGDWKGKYFSTNRRRLYSVVTTLNDQDGKLTVKKEKVYNSFAADDSESVIRQRLNEEVYYPGELYTVRLKKLLASPHCTIEELITWCRPWIALLKDSITEKNSDNVVDSLLRSDCFDLVPHNLIETDQGELKPFDNEWELSFNPPLFWIAVRGLLQALEGCAERKLLSDYSYPDLLIHLLKGCDLELNQTHLRQAVILEERIIKEVVGEAQDIEYVNRLLNRERIGGAETLNSALKIAEEEIKKLNLQVSQVQKTFSETNLKLNETTLKLKEANQRLFDIENSLSWRIVKRISRLADWFRSFCSAG